MEHAFRQDGLAFMRAQLKNADENTLAAEEKAVWEKCSREEHAELEPRYRCEIREAVYGQRSRAQSPAPPDPVEPKRNSKTIPACKTCGKNDRVTYELVQRHRSDEGMTPEYSCSRCSMFWQ